jgi:ABC-type nitrate/sulfonate/bicarbonate transport system substrate-binding protein
VLAVGSLLDEPFTGVVYLKESGITSDFRSLKGKRIGYVGEFGKVRSFWYSFGVSIRQLISPFNLPRSKSTNSPNTTG